MANYSSNKRVYYSDTKPEGQGKVDPSEYDYAMSDRMKELYYNNPTILGLFMGKGVEPREKKEVAEMQQFLLDFGYFDEEAEVDSLFGPKTAGAMHRYILNRPGYMTRVIDYLNDE